MSHKHTAPYVRHPYDGNNKKISDETGLFFPPDEPSLAKQAFADECDINNIMAQYNKTGLLTHVNTYQGQYGDLGESHTFHDALNVVSQAQEAFDSLPANIRSKFQNDPGRFLDFVNNPDNLKEMSEMGLLQPYQPQAATPIADDTPEPPIKAPKSKQTASEPE